MELKKVRGDKVISYKLYSGIRERKQEYINKQQSPQDITRLQI